jgi:phospholipid-binding lipoprotein MlaA
MHPPFSNRHARRATSVAVRLCSLGSFILLAACAQEPSDKPLSDRTAAAEESNDPAESVNRAIFAGNEFLDRNLMKPTAQAYLDYVPSPAQHAIHNFVTNLREPEVLMNDMLQGNARRASVTTQRFLIDTTIGVGGLFDVASGWDLPAHAADFGQTFGVWGIGPGPSVQLPLFGPSNVRDAVGKVASVLADPLSQADSSVATDITIGGAVAGAIDARAEILPSTDTLEQTSLDYYAALRSLEAQHRAALVEEGREGKVTNTAAASATPDTAPQP